MTISHENMFVYIVVDNLPFYLCVAGRKLYLLFGLHNYASGDFHGGPLVKILHFHSGSSASIPGEELDPPCCAEESESDLIPESTLHPSHLLWRN